MPLSRCLPVTVVFFICLPMWAQTTRSAPEPPRDPRAVAVVETAIRALGGTAAIRQGRNWAFQGQSEGRFENGSKSETLFAKAEQAPRGAAAVPANPSERLPSWAKARSFSLPAVVGQLLVEQSEGGQFSMELQASPPGLESFWIVAFSIYVGEGRTIPAQIWRFDKTTGLPSWIWFKVPAVLGPLESYAGVVFLSDYRAVGGVKYPHRIETILSGEQEKQVVTLQSVTPNTVAARPAGGAR